MPLSITSAWKRYNLEADLQESKDDSFLLIVEDQIHKNVEYMRIIYIVVSLFLSIHSLIHPAKYFCQLEDLLNQKNYGTFRRLIFVEINFRETFCMDQFSWISWAFWQIRESSLILLSPIINLREFFVEVFSARFKFKKKSASNTLNYR